MAYQDDKYENFMTKLAVNRAAFAKFGAFTATAIQAPAVDPLIAGHRGALEGALKAYEQELVERVAAGGTSEVGTATEDDAYAAFRAFIRQTDIDLLKPYLSRHPSEASYFYPQKLSGLTQAAKRDRPTRLKAYTEALEQADSRLPALPVPPGAPAGTVGARPGAAARALLTAYEAALQQKTGSRTGLKGAIADLSPAEKALAEALWEVHCAALYVHRKEPRLARQYFDYAGLPTWVTKAGAKRPRQTAT